jgi:hypothetical protein
LPRLSQEVSLFQFSGYIATERRRQQHRGAAGVGADEAAAEKTKILKKNGATISSFKTHQV